MAKKKQATAPAVEVAAVAKPRESTLTEWILHVHGYVIFWVALLFLGESIGFSVRKIGMRNTME